MPISKKKTSGKKAIKKTTKKTKAAPKKKVAAKKAKAGTKKKTVSKKTKSATKKKPTIKKKTNRAPKKTKSVETFKTLAIINDSLSQLENQALKAYECVQAIKKRSTPDWKAWIEKLPTQDWMALASAQRDRIKHEVKNLSDEILSKIHGADVLSNKDTILDEAKKSLEDTVDQIEDSTLVTKAIDTAIHTKDGLLAFLNIPTHEEMIHLQRKLNRLERKINQLGK